MKLTDHITCAFDDALADKFESALLHACIAIDATSKRLYPDERQVGVRYINCLRSYYWIIEPMMGSGINLVETKFSNIKLRKSTSPDLAEIIYEIFRCSHAHGDEVPLGFSVILSPENLSKWTLGYNELHMPDRIVWALLAVSVFSRVNIDTKNTGGYCFTLGDYEFEISKWWGQEESFRPFALHYNQTRVKLDALERIEKQPDA